jgi:pimeloyl-ACP methyl ester carboxylesterase
MPGLLLWGSADPISPPAAGRRLLELLPKACLRVIEGGDHAFAHERAAEVAPLIRQFLLS